MTYEFFYSNFIWFLFNFLNDVIWYDVILYSALMYYDMVFNDMISYDIIFNGSRWFKITQYDCLLNHRIAFLVIRLCPSVHYYAIECMYTFTFCFVLFLGIRHSGGYETWMCVTSIKCGIIFTKRTFFDNWWRSRGLQEWL